MDYLKDSRDFIEKHKEKRMLIHNDPDGAFSGLIVMENTGMKIGGINDLKRFYTVQNISHEELFAMDLDMTDIMPSFGHHIIPDGLIIPKEHFNINNYFGITSKDFTSKCSLNSTMLAAKIMKMSFDQDPLRKIAWSTYPDSVILNWLDYPNNTRWWLVKLEMKETLYAFENHFDTLMDIIKREIIPIAKSMNPKSNKRLPQCNFYVRNNRIIQPEDFNRLILLAKEVFGIKKATIPTYYPFNEEHQFMNIDLENKEDVILFERNKDDAISCIQSYKKNIKMTVIQNFRKTRMKD